MLIIPFLTEEYSGRRIIPKRWKQYALRFTGVIEKFSTIVDRIINQDLISRWTFFSSGQQEWSGKAFYAKDPIRVHRRSSAAITSFLCAARRKNKWPPINADERRSK